MTTRVRIAEPAEQHIKQIHEWWANNRASSPGLFLQELEAALALLAESPEIAPRFQRARRSGVRRLLLRRSGFHMYYEYDRTDVVTIYALWSAVRGHGPSV